MTEESEILLNEHFENRLTIGGKEAWVVLDYNASTGYSWRYTPDNSGTTELTETITLHPSTTEVVGGAPGKMIWKFKAVGIGKGAILFESYPPGIKEPEYSIVYHISVEK